METEFRLAPPPRFDLREARLNAGLSYTALAEASGVHRETLTQLEKPSLGIKHNPATVKKVADYFSRRLGRPVTVVDILGPDRPTT
jgi:transcriptional regulator with XRE-family HTH domain